MLVFVMPKNLWLGFDVHIFSLVILIVVGSWASLFQSHNHLKMLNAVEQVVAPLKLDWIRYCVEFGILASTVADMCILCLCLPPGTTIVFQNRLIIVECFIHTCLRW